MIMKKVSNFFLMVCVVVITFLTLTAFNNHYPIITDANSQLSQGEPFHITFNRNAARTFTTHGAVNSSGTWQMTVTTTGSAFHCINTLISSEGTLVAISHCNNTTMNGVWQIISGTGIYEGMKGNGSLMMLSYGEEWEGTVK